MDKLVCVDDFEREAAQILGQNTLDYYGTGADDELALVENKRAFKRWLIRPRMLRDVSKRNLSTKILGREVDFPIGISPTGMQKLCHEQGELANARAAASLNTIYILSTFSTFSIEEVAQASPNGRKWFQLYVYKEREISKRLVERAESCGFEALVLTVDVPVGGKRRRNMRNRFHLPKHLRLANFESGSEYSESLASSTEKGGSRLSDVIAAHFDPSVAWVDIDWLKAITKLPIIVKGILTAEDARLAVEHGVAGVFVSNHGGRQLDTVHPTIDVLEEIVHAVNGRCEIYLDSGVSSGSDAFKALALGAKMVFAGRPFLWGLSVGGEQGSRRVLEILRDELDLTMSLAGTSSIREIERIFVERASTL